jgi:photosystem II stability/assembly factor-like uncharacterized protein
MRLPRGMSYWWKLLVLMSSLTTCALLGGLGPQPAPDAPFAAHRSDAWKIIGPGGGGAQFNPTISPLDPKKVFVNTDMTGAFVSEDGGNTWRMFNLRGVVRFFVCDPVSPDVVYAQTVGLWRSADGGKTWNLVHPVPSNVRKLASLGDHAEDRILTKDGSRETIEALAVDPANSRTLYAAMSDGGKWVLSISSDWGKTWKQAGSLPEGVHKIYVDPKSAQGDRTLYAVGASSVSVREAGGWTHHKGPEGVKAFNGVSAGFPAGGGKPTIYSVAGRSWRGGSGGTAGIYKSTDGGETWQRIDEGLLSMAAKGVGTPEWRAVGTCLTQPDAVYVSYRRLRLGPSREETYLGVAKSVDGGKTWSLVWKDTDSQAGANIRDAWINERFGPEWGENPFHLEVAATNPDICFGTDFGRTMRTLDGGKTWEGVYSRRTAQGTWSTTGIDVTTCYWMHFDPFDPNRMFISYTDIGLFLSEDGGRSWMSTTKYGVPREWVNTTYGLVFDPKVKGHIWAVMSGVHDLPRPKMWRGRGVGRYNGGVVTSEDGGKTWTVSNTGINEAAVTHIVLDPASTAGGRTVYVCAFGKGVYRSTDNGKTWTLKNDGIHGQEPFAWALTLADDGTLYLVVARRSEDGSIGDENDGALYRSTDGAEHWIKIALPEGCNGPTSLAIDTHDQKRLILSAWGRVHGIEGDAGGGIYISQDSGNTWRQVLEKDQHIHDVTLDTRNNAYYACGFGSSAYRSTDRGETWTRIKGFNFKWGRRVIPDPYNPANVYITTFGGSVWYGPALGDPKAAEDIATPIVAYQ